MTSRPDQISTEIAAFVDQARRYCAFVEKAGERSLSVRLADARERLLQLYQAGCALPRIAAPEGNGRGPHPARPEAWPGFEDFEIYWEVFDPYVDEQRVSGSLSDDVLDVYFDVLRGLRLWDAESAKAAVVWEWRHGFDGHWGDHAIDALRALHRACART